MEEAKGAEELRRKKREQRKKSELHAGEEEPGHHGATLLHIPRAACVAACKAVRVSVWTAHQLFMPHHKPEIPAAPRPPHRDGASWWHPRRRRCLAASSRHHPLSS